MAYHIKIDKHHLISFLLKTSSADDKLITEIILNVKNNHNFGFDGFSNQLFKKSVIIVKPIILNQILKTFPGNMKKAKIIPLYTQMIEINLIIINQLLC